jgi:hypothetical protein
MRIDTNLRFILTDHGNCYAVAWAARVTYQECCQPTKNTPGSATAGISGCMITRQDGMGTVNIHT